MILTFRDLQKRALQGLSQYSIELNGIYQKEIHQNIDIMNFVNARLFAGGESKQAEGGLVVSEVMEDTGIDERS